jgi:subtilisin family serine protease
MNSRPTGPTTLAFVAALFACALTPAAATAQGTPAADAGLSARLAQLADTGLRNASPARQAAAVSLPDEGPGSLLRDGRRLYVEVRFAAGALAGVPALRQAGAEIVDASRRLQAITVAAAPGRLRSLAAVDGVEIVHEVLAPVTRAACQGSVTSEGDTQLLAAAAREDFGVDGSGVQEGILSDSFDRDPGAATDAADDVASGDLPGSGNPCGHSEPVGILAGQDFLAPGDASDEGRGMAQIVHDLAPGAEISFASAFASEAAFAGNIRGLAEAGANVIVDDVAWFEEPFFQDGPVANAISDVAAAGTSYLTSAGNDNLDEGANEISSWEAPDPFREAGGCPAPLDAAAVATVENCLDFDPAPGPGNVDDTFGIIVEAGAELIVDLQWAEPWKGVEADLDAYLLDEDGEPLEEKVGSEMVLVGSYGNNLAAGNQRPVEVFGWENDGPETEVQLVVDRCIGVDCNKDASAAAKPRVKFILLQNGGGVSSVEYPISQGGDVVGPSVYGHAAAPAAISVGAVPYSNSSVPEPYTSRGPAKHYFAPINETDAGIPSAVPAAKTAEQVIPKPEVAATDCGRTTFFIQEGPPNVFRFCGTSAAAPHAAAVAALALQANPSLTPAQIGQGLADTARPLATAYADAVGAGLVDAHEMVEETALPPRITITSQPADVGRETQPSIGFEANRPVTFRCELDGGAPFPCSSPFRPERPLGDGLHGFVVNGVDLAGREGSSPVTYFRVDTRPPRTFVAGHPRKRIRIRKRRVKVAFRFRSNEEGSQFTCRVDGGLFRFCSTRIVRRVGPGRHSVRVKAVDPAGNVDPTPAIFRYRVKRAR